MDRDRLADDKAFLDVLADHLTGVRHGDLGGLFFFDKWTKFEVCDGKY